MWIVEHKTTPDHEDNRVIKESNTIFVKCANWDEVVAESVYGKQASYVTDSTIYARDTIAEIVVKDAIARCGC